MLLREAFAANRGDEIDTQGDSFFAAFRGASDAIACAVAIQRVLADHEWPEGAEPCVRIGIHSGEAAAAGERYVGFSVHRAARVGAAAHGGQVLVSDSTRSLVEDDLPAGVLLRDLGVHRLKDVDRPERIAQVATEGKPAEFPPLRGAVWAPARRSDLPPANYLVSVLQSLGYKARLQRAGGPAEFFVVLNDSRHKVQIAGPFGIGPDWASPSAFFSPFTCAAFHPASEANANESEFAIRVSTPRSATPITPDRRRYRGCSGTVEQDRP